MRLRSGIPRGARLARCVVVRSPWSFAPGAARSGHAGLPRGRGRVRGAPRDGRGGGRERRHRLPHRVARQGAAARGHVRGHARGPPRLRPAARLPRLAHVRRLRHRPVLPRLDADRRQHGRLADDGDVRQRGQPVAATARHRRLGERVARPPRLPPYARQQPRAGPRGRPHPLRLGPDHAPRTRPPRHPHPAGPRRLARRRRGDVPHHDPRLLERRRARRPAAVGAGRQQAGHDQPDRAARWCS